MNINKRGKEVEKLCFFASTKNNNMSPKIKIKVGTRDSRLALAQVEEVFSLLKAQKISLPFGIIKFKSKGDKDRTIPLSDPRIPDDFFTDTLDEALLKKQIDIAIHSAKDLPQKIREGLNIFALTKSLDETDAFVGKKKLADLTKGAKVGTSSLLRKQSVKEINPKVAVVDVRGNIEERLSLLDKGKFAGLIVATCALKRLKLDHRIIEVLPWEATALQGQLAVVGREDDKNLQAMFASIDVRHQYGQVTLVGAGPGDPELITMKAINALKKADCVFYDYLVHKDLLDYAPLAEKIDVGKRKGEHTLPQEILSRMMRQKAMEEKRVVRLKGGDPLIFGRGADEIKYLQAYHIRVDVIPGISSATGIPSILGIPLTARGISSSVAFLSGHEESERHKDPQPVSIPKVDTIVFLMGLTKLNVIVRSLLKAGWEKNSPMIVISKGTRIDEKIVSGTIATIESLVEAEKLEPPALMIVGEIVKFWDGQKRQESILYLGTDPEKYKILGQIIHFPMIEISPVTVDSRAATKLLKELEQYHLIILTSRLRSNIFSSGWRRNVFLYKN